MRQALGVELDIQVQVAYQRYIVFAEAAMFLGDVG